MVKNYPRGQNFLKKSFHHFFTTDTINWFEQRGVKLKKEIDGRMFPDTDSSQSIIDCMMSEVNKYGIKILMNREVKKLQVINHKLQVIFLNGKEMNSDFVCVASGGYSKSEQFTWLMDLGHSIEQPVPSLFTFNIPDNSITALMGISVDKVSVKIHGTKLPQLGPLLITHWGFSGPAILKLSAFGAKELAVTKYNFSVVVNWVPTFNENNLRLKLQDFRIQLASQKISNRNPFFLPNRLWNYMLQQSGINGDLRWADVPAKQQNLLVKNLSAQEFLVRGKTTFKEEFVTAGGINLSEIDASTMKSKIISNLYFAGEIMNVDGITGGFNFQHAWTSGWIAGNSIGNTPLLGKEYN
jgi:predicted Rossmann fold flavoprotein